MGGNTPAKKNNTAKKLSLQLKMLINLIRN